MTNARVKLSDTLLEPKRENNRYRTSLTSIVVDDYFMSV